MTQGFVKIIHTCEHILVTVVGKMIGKGIGQKHWQNFRIAPWGQVHGLMSLGWGGPGWVGTSEAASCVYDQVLYCPREISLELYRFQVKDAPTDVLFSTSIWRERSNVSCSQHSLRHLCPTFTRISPTEHLAK